MNHNWSDVRTQLEQVLEQERESTRLRQQQRNQEEPNMNRRYFSPIFMRYRMLLLTLCLIVQPVWSPHCGCRR